ncbi:Adenosine monophosphate-protein like [Actinidia chinensis var. chinensis]|uniref:Adenosine monophosphate-protein like n=1 Tax=Actinidia chinensis var. chinensis TaxID=1590841 RepID=A0A2R6QPF8_ACTCC|nr:Adenosine monophosphate-protein like [Actinidia chinensis var. chinensis]
MRALIIRTGSVPGQKHSLFPGSPRVSACQNNLSLHLDVSRRRDSSPATVIRRALSETDVIRSEFSFSRLSGVGSRSLPARIPEEELEFPGGGIGKGRNSGGFGGSDGFGDGTFTGGDADRSKMGAYYQEMLKSNPTDSLLLRNYGRFLHEIEGDVVKAEEYYGRAILASPGDGEVLALYGNLIWETQRDGDRAKSYFDRAVHSSPDDCMVLGSYAHFMWEAEDEEEGGDGGLERENDYFASMVEAF